MRPMQASRNASNVLVAAGRASCGQCRLYPGDTQASHPCFSRAPTADRLQKHVSRTRAGLQRWQSPVRSPAAFSSASAATESRGWRHTQHASRCSSFQTRAASGNGASSNGASSTPEYDYDLFTIGAGSGGTRASRLSASLYGVRVGVAEMPFGAIASDSVGGAGGTCVLRGCVPKKLFVYAASYPEEFNAARGFGWDVPDNITQDWMFFLAKKRKELDRLHGVYMNMLQKAGCDMFEGRGTVVDAHTVEVNGKRYTAKNILIAVGGRAVKLNFEGAEHAIISDDILELEAVPKKLIVIGSGYIGLEFSCIFHNLGAEVHVMFRQDKPLRGFDEEVRAHAADQYSMRGLHLHPGTSPERIVKNDDGSVTLYAKTKDGTVVVETADHVLMATGRKPNTRNLGLEKAGVEMEEKTQAIKVDEFSRTTCPSIWAVGDVTDRMNLTPVALMEGMALVHYLFGDDPNSRPAHENVASAVFTTPQIATVGLTEEQAAKKYPNLNIYKSTFRPMKGTISGNEGKSMMKIIADADSDRVLGMHMVGEDSAEIMQGMAVGVKLGMTKKQLDSVVGIHPTAAEELVTMREASRQIREKEVVKA